MPQDRGTLAIKARKERIEKTLERITDNPGISGSRLKAGLVIEMGVSPPKVEEYIRTLSEAGLIIVKEGCFWTPKAYEDAQSEAKEKAFLLEETLVEKARRTGQEPLDNFSREDI